MKVGIQDIAYLFSVQTYEKEYNAQITVQTKINNCRESITLDLSYINRSKRYSRTP